MAKPPRMTVKLRYDKKVRSFAKKTFGSTRVGIAMRFPGADWRRGWEDIVSSLWLIFFCLGSCLGSWGKVWGEGGARAVGVGLNMFRLIHSKIYIYWEGGKSGGGANLHA